jgi:ribosomal protein S18 acetylase RimI-like enzyme
MLVGDLPSVIRLAEEECERFGPVARWIQTWFGEGPARATLVEVDGDVAGFSLCMPVSPEPWWECRLAAVAPTHQRCGIARRLLEADQQAARQAGRDIVLTVAVNNEPIKALVAHLGYRRILTQRLAFPDGTEAHVLRWTHIGIPYSATAG